MGVTPLWPEKPEERTGRRGRGAPWVGACCPRPRPSTSASPAPGCGSPTHPGPLDVHPHRTPSSPVCPACAQASLRLLPQSGYLCVRGRAVSRPRVSSANTERPWAWLLLPVSSCSHPQRPYLRCPSGTSYVVLRDCPLRGQCLRSPHTQPRAQPRGGAPGVLQAADKSVWRPPVCGVPPASQGLGLEQLPVGAWLLGEPRAWGRAC